MKSRPLRWPMKTAPHIFPERSSWPWVRSLPSLASPNPSAPAQAWAGTNTTTASFTDAKSSFAPATQPISSHPGFPPSTASGKSASTVLMAQAFPNSQFFGFDYHDKSIEAARESAERAGVADRVTFAVASAKNFPGSDYDLVTFFDCLHDMGDPAGAAAHVRKSVSRDGVWMIVEPFAHDELKDNLNPVGRIYYSFSTLLCTPCSRSQEVGLCLGAQAGEARIRDVVTSAGFTRFRRATETPFNIVYEARP